MIGTIILGLLFLGFVAAIPVWPYSRSWGYAPSAVSALVALAAIALLLSGTL